MMVKVFQKRQGLDYKTKVYFLAVNGKDGREIYKPFIKCINCKVKLPFY